MNRIQQIFLFSAITVVGLFKSNPEIVQESERNIERPGRFTKFLTPASMDRWTFRGRKGETILVEVTTSEFDSVVSLRQCESDSKEKSLHQVDDDGSNCRLAFRLPADGEYKIGVTGFEQKGGGNYAISIQKFLAKEIRIDQLTTGKYDDKGQAFFYFTSEADQYLTIDSKKQILTDQFVLLDDRGAPVTPSGLIYELKENGEYRLQLSGPQKQPFQIRLRPALRDSLRDAVEWKRPLEARQAVVLDYEGSVGDFRMIELTSKNSISSQFVFATKRNLKDRSLDEEPSRPELSLLSTFEKGTRKHDAVILGREDRYRLVLYSDQGEEVSVRIADTRENLTVNQTERAQLPVGGTRFYRLQPKPGQTTTFRVRTDEFDPFIELFDQHGNQISSNDDERSNELNCRLRYTSYTDATLILAIKSFGNGGAGMFDLSASAETAQSLPLGETKSRNENENTNDLWSFSAKKSQQVIFYCQSKSPVQMTLRNAKGSEKRQVRSDDGSNGAVMLCKFSNSGDFTIEIACPYGENYTVRAMGVD